MEKLFEKLIKRSSFRDGFYKNEILPKKYYKFPLCNVNQDINVDKKFFIDNDKWYNRAPDATDQLKELGFDYRKTFDMSLVNSEQNKNIWNWAKSWHLKNPVAQIHNQKPGQLHPFHMDVIESYNNYISDPIEKEKKVKRVFVFLNNWAPGQVIVLGTKTITGWNKGDVLWFDWYHVPHGTANFSRRNRMMLQITGETTPEFEELLKK